jgi:hypothetical protein
VRGDVDAVAEIEGFSLEQGRMTVTSSRITADDVAVQLGATSPRGDAPPGSADLRAKRVELRAKIEDLELAHPSLHGVDYRLIVDDAAMDDATRLGALFSSSAAPTAFAIESGSARGSADITVTPSQRTANGGVKLAFENAGVRFHDTHLAGSFEADVVVKGLVPGDDLIDVSGSHIALRGVTAVGGKARSTAWNGDIALLQGALRLTESPAFDGFVQVHADDANPILAIALGNSLPNFLVGMLKAPGLAGQARITVEPDRAAILDAHVRGDDVELAGDYVSRHGHVRGALTVAKGPLSAGVKLDDRGTYVRLFRLASWREEEKKSVLELFGPAGDAKPNADAKAKASP